MGLDYLNIERQLTKEEALALFNGGEWRSWTDEQRCGFQLFQDRLCMDFPAFHQSIEKTLGRPVYTHEFALRDHLQKEYLGLKETASFEDVVAMAEDLAGKDRVMIVTHSDGDGSA